MTLCMTCMQCHATPGAPQTRPQDTAVALDNHDGKHTVTAKRNRAELTHAKKGNGQRCLLRVQRLRMKVNQVVVRVLACHPHCDDTLIVTCLLPTLPSHHSPDDGFCVMMTTSPRFKPSSSTDRGLKGKTTRYLSPIAAPCTPRAAHAKKKNEKTMFLMPLRSSRKIGGQLSGALLWPSSSFSVVFSAMLQVHVLITRVDL
jgi:hypothetical protein